MKKWNLFLISVCLCYNGICQKPKITWGDEFKLRKGSTDLDVVYADKTGVYLQESHLALKSYFVIGSSARTSATLIKLDKNLTEQYRSDFNKELRGKEFEQFFVLQDKVFILSSHINKKEQTLDIFTAELDKNSGELAGEWQPLTSFQKEEKRDYINFKISLNADSSRIVLVNTIEGKERSAYQVQEFDKNMKETSKPVTITNEFDPKTFQLEDVLYTTNKKIILVGRIYEYQEGKRKKDKFLDFVNYTVRIYDQKGKQQTEINTNINSKWLISTKLLQEKDKDLVLAAFYSREKRGTIDGMLVQRIDALTGNIISTSEKEISNSLLATAEEDNGGDDNDGDDESKAERKEREKLDKVKDEGEGFSRYMQFRKIFYTADQGLVILAEKYHHYTYTTQRYNPGSNGMVGRWTTTTYSVFECGDLMMCKTDAGGNINWLQVLPKQQREVISTDNNSNSFLSSSYNFFNAMNMPFYAGFGAIQSNDAIHIIFNDNSKNAEVLRPGQKVKIISRFSKSECFVLSINEATGKYTRNMFFNNTNFPTAMPRLGSVIGNDMYIVGKEDRIFGKTKIAVARINVK